ncbi:hypothetical protein [Candidatus Leptofilum sp.]|uniref:hypothetical protein n=1 Tax=Candidatus Leptofilum sp. TaxID=3241576 RepID=UPI003B5BD705
MTKKAKHLFLTIATLLLIGCGTDLPTPTSQSDSLTTAQAIACTFSIPINEVPDPSPGDTVYLVPQIEENTLGWTFSWRAEPDVLLDDDIVSATLIVPNDVSQIEVDLEAVNAEGCPGVGSLLITVAQPTSAATEAVATENGTESVATLVPTEEATLQPTAVPTDTRAPSPEPTQAPTATETSTSEPLPTSPPQPTATSISPPIITDLELLPSGAVVVRWIWNGQLTPTQNFAVRFWSERDPRPEARFSITWTKENQYAFSVNNVDYPIGTYFVNVAVMEGPSNGVHTEVTRSEDRPLFVDAPDPTTTPPPLP